MLNRTILLLALLACGCSEPNHFDIAEKLRSHGIRVRVEGGEKPHLAKLVEDSTGQVVIVAIMPNRTEAQHLYKNLDPGWRGGAFPSGRVVYAAPREADGPLLTRMRRVID